MLFSFPFAFPVEYLHCSGGYTAPSDVTCAPQLYWYFCFFVIYYFCKICIVLSKLIFWQLNQSNCRRVDMCCHCVTSCYILLLPAEPWAGCLSPCQWAPNNRNSDIPLQWIFIYHLNCCHVISEAYNLFNLLPMAPVGFRETLDGWPPPISSAG